VIAPTSSDLSSPTKLLQVQCPVSAQFCHEYKHKYQIQVFYRFGGMLPLFCLFYLLSDNTWFLMNIRYMMKLEGVDLYWRLAWKR
jgi:hypothetical protein